MGSVAAAIKIALGIIQAVGGLLIAIFTLPFAFNTTSREWCYRGLSHFVNGVANIIAGALEAIPLVGTMIYFGRSSRMGDADEHGNKDIDKLNRSVFDGKLKGQRNMILVGYSALAGEQSANDVLAPLIVV